MSTVTFLARVRSGNPVTFNESISVINQFYDYTPTHFTNGLGSETLINEAGVNEGSCRIFAFASLNCLSIDETLALFGEIYREEVLKNPDGLNHQNIRTFMKHGWSGISFKGEPLKHKQQE